MGKRKLPEHGIITDEEKRARKEREQPRAHFGIDPAKEPPEVIVVEVGESIPEANCSICGKFECACALKEESIPVDSVIQTGNNSFVTEDGKTVHGEFIPEGTKLEDIATPEEIEAVKTSLGEVLAADIPEEPADAEFTEAVVDIVEKSAVLLEVKQKSAVEEVIVAAKGLPAVTVRADDDVFKRKNEIKQAEIDELKAKLAELEK